MWVLGAPTMSASVVQFDNSLFARSRDLDTLYLQIATVSIYSYFNSTDPLFIFILINN